MGLYPCQVSQWYDACTTSAVLCRNSLGIQNIGDVDRQKFQGKDVMRMGNSKGRASFQPRPSSNASVYRSKMVTKTSKYSTYSSSGRWNCSKMDTETRFCPTHPQRDLRCCVLCALDPRDTQSRGIAHFPSSIRR